MAHAAGPIVRQIESLFENPDNLLRPGQFARVRAVTESLKGALVVPQRAVQEVQGNHQVAVVGADDTVAIRGVWSDGGATTGSHPQLWSWAIAARDRRHSPMVVPTLWGVVLYGTDPT